MNRRVCGNSLSCGVPAFRKSCLFLLYLLPRRIVGRVSFVAFEGKSLHRRFVLDGRCRVLRYATLGSRRSFEPAFVSCQVATYKKSGQCKLMMQEAGNPLHRSDPEPTDGGAVCSPAPRLHP